MVHVAFRPGIGVALGRVQRLGKLARRQHPAFAEGQVDDVDKPIVPPRTAAEDNRLRLVRSRIRDWPPGGEHLVRLGFASKGPTVREEGPIATGRPPKKRACGQTPRRRSSYASASPR